MSKERGTFYTLFFGGKFENVELVFRPIKDYYDEKIYYPFRFSDGRYVMMDDDTFEKAKRDARDFISKLHVTDIGNKEEMRKISRRAWALAEKDDAKQYKAMTLGEFFKPTEEQDSFDGILKQMSELHAKKNKDYGNAWAEVLDKQMTREKALAYIAGRLYEKANRLMSISTNGAAEVKYESIEDTILDSSVYGVMSLEWLRKNRNNG